MLLLSVPPPSPPCLASTPLPLVRTPIGSINQRRKRRDPTKKNEMDQRAIWIRTEFTQKYYFHRENILGPTSLNWKYSSTFMHHNRGVGPRCHRWWSRWLRRCHQGCSARSQGKVQLCFVILLLIPFCLSAKKEKRKKKRLTSKNTTGNFVDCLC